MARGGELGRLREELLAQGENEVAVQECTLISAGATLGMGKGAMHESSELAFEAALLGPFFSRYTIQHGRTVPATAPFDCSR